MEREIKINNLDKTIEVFKNHARLLKVENNQFTKYFVYELSGLEFRVLVEHKGEFNARKSIANSLKFTNGIEVGHQIDAIYDEFDKNPNVLDLRFYNIIEGRFYLKKSWLILTSWYIYREVNMRYLANEQLKFNELLLFIYEFCDYINEIKFTLDNTDSSDIVFFQLFNYELHVFKTNGVSECIRIYVRETNELVLISFPSETNYLYLSDSEPHRFIKYISSLMLKDKLERELSLYWLKNLFC